MVQDFVTKKNWFKTYSNG